MDKISVALATAEDNAAAIRELSKAFSRKTACKVVSGVAAGAGTYLGEFTSDGNVGVLVFFAGTSVGLVFCGKTIATSTSPILAVLPAGSGELKLSAGRSSTRAIVIGSS